MDDAWRDDYLSLLVTEHGQAVLAYVAKLTSDRYGAEDILQETLIRAWQNAERLRDGEGSVRGWLLKVARNIVIDRSRAGVARWESLEPADEEAEQRDHADAVVASVLVGKVLATLSAEHRDVLNLVYMQGRTVREAAETLRIPVGTAKSRNHYARDTLRKMLAPEKASSDRRYGDIQVQDGDGHAAVLLRVPAPVRTLDIPADEAGPAEPGGVAGGE